MTPTILTMSNGKGIDLLNPKVSDIDFLVIAEHLAKDNRYCGATKGLVYSVAEHSVRGADSILRSTNDGVLAGYFLCHDMHEAYLGDDTTPKKRALGELAAREFGVLSEEIMSAFDMLTNKFDVVIHEAAGLSWPPPLMMRAAIKQWDRHMLATEWRDLMRLPLPDGYEDAAPLPDQIEPMPDWMDAACEFSLRCQAILPGLHVHQELMRRGEAS